MRPLHPLLSDFYYSLVGVVSGQWQFVPTLLVQCRPPEVMLDVVFESFILAALSTSAMG